MEEAERKIDSLRAMLLAERSKSKMARQKADQLAQRVAADASIISKGNCTGTRLMFLDANKNCPVAELETQLEVVNNQKKKAEKAAAKVLSILRDGGTIEYSDEGESEVGKQMTSCEYEEKKLMADECPVIEKAKACSLSVVTGDEVKDCEVDKLIASPSTSGSLSWTNCDGQFSGSHGNGTRKSHELAARQKPGNFISVAGSSPKRRLGKSCRQIKRREIGSMKEHGDTDCSQSETLVEGLLNDADDGIGPPSCSETTPEQTSGEENCVTVFPEGTEDIPLAEEGSQFDSGSDASVRDIDEKVEIDQQDMLIDQCQSKENTQQNPEEKAREITISNMVLSEPGEQPDASRKGDTQAVSVDIENSVAYMKSTPKLNNSGESVIGTCVCDVLPEVCQDTVKTVVGSNGKPIDENELAFAAIPSHRSRGIALGFPADNFASGSAKNNNGSGNTSLQEFGYGDVPVERDSCAAPSKGKQVMFYVETPSPSTPGSLKSQISLRGSSDNQNAVVPSASQSHIGSTSPNDLEGVLKNLQRARLSIQSRLEKSPPNKGTIVAIHDQAKMVEENMKLPFISCAGLFRLPPSLDESGTRFTSRALRTNLVSAPALGNQYHHRHPDPRSQVSCGNVYPYAASIAPSSSPTQQLYSRFAGFQYSHSDEQNRNFRR